MARMQWANGNQGFYGYDQFDAYVAGAVTATGMVLDYDLGLGTLDPEVLAARIELSFTGVTTYVVESGPDAGEVRVLGGTLTGVRYLDGAGTTLLSISNLRVALPIFLATLERGDAATAWAMVTHGANTIVGSADASAPGHAGTGDVIDTGVSADQVRAGAGDDFVKDQGGVDAYDGGAGFDTVSYDGWFYQPQNALRGIDVDLLTGLVTGPDGAVDTLTAVEAVTGTFLADAFSGDGLANKFTGLAGADRIDGRGGFDFASYATDAGQGGTDAVRVNLTTGVVRDGFGFRDTLISIEGVEGSRIADSFTDNGANNYFDGGGGNDVLRFTGGNDTGHGGAGADQFVFRGTVFDDDTVNDFSQAEGDRILFEAATSYAELHMVDVEAGVNVQFASGTVTILGITVAQLTAADFGF